MMRMLLLGNGHDSHMCRLLLSGSPITGLEILSCSRLVRVNASDQHSRGSPSMDLICVSIWTVWLAVGDGTLVPFWPGETASESTLWRTCVAVAYRSAGCCTY
uniref:Uncharacterized protein n=1 Tax=Arundo donax TaxID=35708 RepID=A0A0A9ATW7_ARUDO